jgi:hypothetical protein
VASSHRNADHRRPFRRGTGSVGLDAAAARSDIEMTRQKTFKRRLRARMEKTGESYTAARRMLIAAGARPEAAPFEPLLEGGEG